ncbi:MAG: hypothetical protein ACLFT0_12560 [Spirulinaceae cyanobacterium]
MDFTPFLRLPNADRFVILHFQGKPKYYRQWGIYSVKLDEYFSRGWQQIKFDKGLTTHAYSLDETKYKTLPSSVMVYENAKLEVNELSGEILIKNDRD